MTTAIRPDVIFAESVGSCADLVATVIKPLLQFRPKKDTISSFSVFADIRLLELSLLHKELPFSDAVTYVFNQQIEEAGLLVINKSDLLSPERKSIVAELAQKQYPHKQVLLQNSQNTAQVKQWLDCLESGKAGLPDQSLDLDYQRYAMGESRLAWLDAMVEFTTPLQPNHQVIINILNEITARVQKIAKSIGHLKFAIRTQDGVTVKLSFTALEDQAAFIHSADETLNGIQGPVTQLLINIRVEGNAGELKTRVHEIIEKEISRVGGNIGIMKINSFYPRPPVPAYHLK
jgi:G3E family GTPase